MKQFTSILCALMIVLSANAAPLKNFMAEKGNATLKVEKTIKKDAKQVSTVKPFATKSLVKKQARKAARRAKLDTPLASGTFYTVGGTFAVAYSNTWYDYTSEMPSVQVTVDGNQVSIAGLGYWYNGAVTGTIEGNIITIPSGQKVGTDSDGDGFIVGSNDWSTPCDIEFEYDPETQTLTSNTAYIHETDGANSVSSYCYWEDAVFCAVKPVAPAGGTFVADEVSAEFYTTDNDIYYVLTCSEDNLEFYFDIVCAEGDNDVVLGQTYTLENMLAKYTNAFFNKTVEIAFASVSFTKTLQEDGSKKITVICVDNDGNTWNLSAIQPAAPAGGDFVADDLYFYSSLAEGEAPDTAFYVLYFTEDKLSFRFLILVDGEDVESGKTYSLADMNVGYSWGDFNDEEYISYETVSFTKTVAADESYTIAVTILDIDGHTWNLSAAQAAPLKPVEVPEGLETATYLFNGMSEEEVTANVLVGFDGNKVYFGGLAIDFDSWIVGTLDEQTGVVSIPETYIGSFWGYDITLLETTLLYDAENNLFTSDLLYFDWDGELWNSFSDVTISLLTEFAATPVNPSISNFYGLEDWDNWILPKVEFEVPLKDADDNDLIAGYMSYVFYVQKDGEEPTELVFTPDLYENLEADMSEILYTFTDDYDFYNGVVYLNQGEEELRSWDALGLQSIYRGGGEEHRSEIVWFDVKAYWEEQDGGATAIDNQPVNGKNEKILRDGQLYIMYNGTMYNVLGAIVK